MAEVKDYSTLRIAQNNKAMLSWAHLVLSHSSENPSSALASIKSTKIKQYAKVIAKMEQPAGEMVNKILKFAKVERIIVP